MFVNKNRLKLICGCAHVHDSFALLNLTKPNNFPLLFLAPFGRSLRALHMTHKSFFFDRIYLLFA